MAKYKVASKVQWKWLGKPIQGKVEQVFKSTISKTIKGKKITRHGTEELPAYLVRSEAGNLALKLESELETPKSKIASSAKPQMFKEP